MRVKTVAAVLRAYAIAFGLSLAVLGMGVGLAHAGQNQPAGQALATTGQLASGDQGFVCHAQPGSWCDLRDWSQFGGPKQPTQGATHSSRQAPIVWE